MKKNEIEIINSIMNKYKNDSNKKKVSSVVVSLEEVKELLDKCRKILGINK